MKKNIARASQCLAVGLATIALTGCSQQAEAADQVSVVTVGVVGDFHDQWEVVNANLASEGIRVELVHFTDGTLLNAALGNGDIDLNAFQNVGFFDQQVEQLGLELGIVGYTFVSPMNVFAGGGVSISPDATRESLAGLLPGGAVIGIPNNVTNASRSLRLLESAGLIGLDSAPGYLVSEADITYNPFNISIRAVEATTLVSLLPDLHAAVINAPQALNGGISPTYDTIFREDAFGLDIAESLVNVIVARSSEVSNPLFTAILSAYQQPNVAEVFATTFQGAFVPVW